MILIRLKTWDLYLFFFFLEFEILHDKVIKRILCYLKHIISFSFFFSNSNHSLQYGFSDVNWAADNDDRKSIGVHCSFHGHNHISWSCKKQKKIACSSMESEYKSLSNSAAEIQWLHSILQYDLLSVPSYGVIILEKPICIRIPY